MLKQKRTKTVALVLVMLFALHSTGIVALADLAANAAPAMVADPQVSVPAQEASAPSANTGEAETPAEIENAVEAEDMVQAETADPTQEEAEGEDALPPMPEDLPLAGDAEQTAQRALYLVKFLAPNGDEYFTLEVEEHERIAKPLFTPELNGYAFGYWYQEIPVDPDDPSLGVTEQEITFDLLVDRDYTIIAKLVEIPVEEPASPPAEDDAAINEKTTGEEEPVAKRERDSRRDERMQVAEGGELIGTRLAGEQLSLDGLDILIISDPGALLNEVDEEEGEGNEEEGEGTEIDEMQQEDDDGEYDAIIGEDEDSSDGEAADAAVNEGEAAEEADEEADTGAEDETEDDETEEEPEVTIVNDEDPEELDDELEMADEQVPLAGCAVNVYTNHRQMMPQGDALEVWGELIGFENVDVMMQWQYAGSDGVWHNMPGANELSLCVEATVETVNYAWRLAVAVAN